MKSHVSPEALSFGFYSSLDISWTSLLGIRVVILLTFILQFTLFLLFHGVEILLLGDLYQLLLIHLKNYPQTF